MTAGAVLCGGASRRMGRDKTLIEVGGRAMACRVADAVRLAGCDPVVAVGGDPDGLAALDLAAIADAFPGEGPLGGVITALRWSPDAAVVVVAADLPWLDEHTVRAVAAAGERGGELAVAVTERMQPLCGWWPRRLLPELEAAFAGGCRSMHAMLADLVVVAVPVAAAALRNVNTPADLRE
jgi:molybdenum cofactor guanylyltransferase